MAQARLSLEEAFDSCYVNPLRGCRVGASLPQGAPRKVFRGARWWIPGNR